MRILVFGGLYWVPLILGNYYMKVQDRSKLGQTGDNTTTYLMVKHCFKTRHFGFSQVALSSMVTSGGDA